MGPPAPSAAAAPQAIAQRPVQLQGSALARGVLRLFGWRVQFDGLPAKQGVLVAYPHTSNWDFVVAMLAKWAIGLPVSFWGKDSLFRVPLFGAWLRWLGGIPVDRQAAQGLVGQMIAGMQQACAENRFLWLALSPEGTRRPSAGWRSGFYRVAVQAQVPVAVAYFDYANKRVGVDSFWLLCGQPEADFEMLRQRLAGKRGLRHEWASPIRLIESADASPGQ